MWESKDKNRTRTNNHQYQSRDFDNTDDQSPKCGEGLKDAKVANCVMMLTIEGRTPWIKDKE